MPMKQKTTTNVPPKRQLSWLLSLTMLVAGACSAPNESPGTPTDTTGTPTDTHGDVERPWVLYSSPVIDMHAHNWTNFSTPSANDEEHQRKMLLEYSQYNVVKAVVSGQNFDGAAWARSYPEMFLAGNMIGARPVDPKAPEKGLLPSPSVEELRSAHASGQLHVLGEVGFFYSGLYASGEIARPYFQLAQDLDIPMGYHLMNNSIDPKGPKPTNGSPSQFQQVLRDFPGLRLYIMHAGFPFLEETKALLAEFPDLYVEISWIAVDPQIVGQEYVNKFEPYLKDLIDSGYGKRILYGSDTVLNEQIVGQSIKTIDAFAWLTPQQKADIFYFNAARFLKLPTHEIDKHWNQ